jgi:hypothetical protein
MECLCDGEYERCEGGRADQSAGETLSTIWNAYVTANMKGVRGVERTNQRVR